MRILNPNTYLEAMWRYRRNLSIKSVRQVGPLTWQPAVPCRGTVIAGLFRELATKRRTMVWSQKVEIRSDMRRSLNANAIVSFSTFSQSSKRDNACKNRIDIQL